MKHLTTNQPYTRGKTMKLKNIKVGDTLEVKSSIIYEPLNNRLEPDMLCKVTHVEPLQYDGDLTVRVTFNDDAEWVNHRHLRKPKQLTGSNITRKMLADGETSVLCYVDDDNEEDAVKERVTGMVIGFQDGWFETQGLFPWRYAVPVEEVKLRSRWTHSNGNTYTVFLITNEHSENQERYPTTVVYIDCNGTTWSRPLSDWHRSMTKKED